MLLNLHGFDDNYVFYRHAGNGGFIGRVNSRIRHSEQNPGIIAPSTGGTEIALTFFSLHFKVFYPFV